MNRAKILSYVSVAGAALILLPLRSDGFPSACDSATTSLQSTLNNPVAGDEKFFTLPVGPSNVMFLLDTSGSMNNLPQCGDANTWGDGSALPTCTWPTFGSFSAPTSGNVAGDGTCTVSGNLSWMTNYKAPFPALVDPGHGTATNGLVDQPTWGTGCTGNNCLFQPGAVYGYGSWDEVSAAPTTNPCTVTFTYSDYDCSKSPPTTITNTFTGTLPNCTSCLTGSGASGFYFYKNWTAAYTVNNVTTTGKGKTTTCSGTTLQTQSGGGSNTVLFSGGWLNANPPKFMSARKVIKDTAWIDPATTQPTDQLRIGLSYVSTNISNNAAIVVPLGPSAASSFPVSPSAFVTARQTVLDALNHRSWPSGGLPSLRSGGTPMATGLFHVGQYFTQPNTYTTKFGSTYELSAFAQTSAGLMNAPWVGSGTTSICWSCQKSAVIVVTDGSPNSELTFPAAINTYDDAVYKLTPPVTPPGAGNCGPSTSCSTSPTSACCSPSDSSSNPPSKLPRVAAWLHENDLRPSDLNGNQNLMVSTISLNLPAGSKGQFILNATANMSGGTYKNTGDGQGLAAAVAQAVAQVSNTATSFGSPAATALTTINAVDTKAFITRFKPNQKATWEGHVFEWMLFDEAAAGCDPSKKPNANDPTQQVLCRGKSVSKNFNGDTTPEGYNICTGSFLVDADCDEVTEDSTTGNWFKKGSGNLAAHMYWDAGQVLSTPGATGYRTAAEHADTGNLAPITQYAPGRTPRNIWTALPDGTMYELETKNAATLAPYMNLDQTWCSSMESLARLCGASPLPACPVTNSGDWKTYCAQQVILFARGWDVMDQDGDSCAGPGNPSNGTSSTSNTTASGTTSCVISSVGTTHYSGEERDRANDALAAPSASASPPPPSFYKLGDVFHSSPVLAHQPTSEAACNFGADNQCVRTLYGYTPSEKYAGGYQTDLDTYAGCKSDTVDAYRAWRGASKARETAVLVGTNDGFLHAFDAGGPDSTPGVDVDCVPMGTLDGTGEELWAFLPSDLLPRLKDTLLNHQYMVDGNVMVRDVWVDGLAGTGNSLDGRKQKNEFRTVAVLSERSGGTQLTALDVTSSFDTVASNRPKPSVLWTFPPPRSDDAQYMGQSWSDFSPRPPPVGPVRLVPGAGDRDPQSKGWVEKWIVMINGGYDPTLTRGRAVWMVDAWTGGVVWRFTDTDFKTNVVGSAGNTSTSMFPVPAGVGLVDIGDPTALTDSDNFFDTATWGDMGGNLFVARFWDPGTRDSSGRVTNWKAARTFEQSRQTNDTQYAGTRTEFFYMTANAYEPQRRSLRTLIGTGNREQILEQGQTCGPDNVFSCCQAGCSVTTTSKMDYGVCNSSGSFSCSSSGQLTSGALSEGCGTSGASACTGGSSNVFKSSSSYTLNCGSGSSSLASASATCDPTGLCTISPVGTGHDLIPSTAGSCSNKARFYGIWSYGGLTTANKTFSTAAGADWSTAQTFDKNRFTDAASYAGCTYTGRGNCSLVETTQAKIDASGALTCADGSTGCQATIDDAGWFYQYNTGPCPTQAKCSTGCTNEKTASGASVVNSCTTWNSFLPLGSAQSGSSTDPCASAGTATQTAIGYASHYVSGTPDTVCNQAKDATLVYRGQQRNTIAPPSAPMVRMGVSGTGQVYYSTLQMDPGGPPSNTAVGQRDLTSPLYWLDVSRDAHNCRHVSGTNCE
jgi:type IV pilus assembly protein PilY1